MSKPFVVTMRDSFMSGWGPAENKTNYYCIWCDSLLDANQIEKAANNRDEMHNVCIRESIPTYMQRGVVTEKDFDDLGTIWTGKRGKA